MKTVFPLKKTAIKPEHIPAIDSLIEERRVIRETPRGFRLCPVDAREDVPGFRYTRQHYDFFDTRAELLEVIAQRANAAAAILDERKKAAVVLLCDAHDALRAERTP